MFQDEIRGANGLAAAQYDEKLRAQDELAKREPTLREHLAVAEAKAHQRLADIEKVRTCFRADLDKPMSAINGTLSVLMAWG